MCTVIYKCLCCEYSRVLAVHRACLQLLSDPHSRVIPWLRASLCRMLELVHACSCSCRKTACLSRKHPTQPGIEAQNQPTKSTKHSLTDPERPRISFSLLEVLHEVPKPMSRRLEKPCAWQRRPVGNTGLGRECVPNKRVPQKALLRRFVTRCRARFDDHGRLQKHGLS